MGNLMSTTTGRRSSPFNQGNSQSQSREGTEDEVGILTPSFDRDNNAKESDNDVQYLNTFPLTVNTTKALQKRSYIENCNEIVVKREESSSPSSTTTTTDFHSAVDETESEQDQQDFQNFQEMQEKMNTKKSGNDTVGEKEAGESLEEWEGGQVNQDGNERGDHHEGGEVEASPLTEANQHDVQAEENEQSQPQPSKRISDSEELDDLLKLTPKKKMKWSEKLPPYPCMRYTRSVAAMETEDHINRLKVILMHTNSRLSEFGKNVLAGVDIKGEKLKKGFEGSLLSKEEYDREMKRVRKLKLQKSNLFGTLNETVKFLQEGLEMMAPSEESRSSSSAASSPSRSPSP